MLVKSIINKRNFKNQLVSSLVYVPAGFILLLFVYGMLDYTSRVAVVDYFLGDGLDGVLNIVWTAVPHSPTHFTIDHGVFNRVRVMGVVVKCDLFASFFSV